MKIGNFQGSNKFEQMEKINKKINMGYMENKKEKNIINKKSILSTFFTSILKFSLAVALLTILAFFVAAGDVIVESGKLNVSNNLYVNDNGNVGIGTVSPSNKLHIKNTGANNILIVDSGDGITQRYSALDLYDNGALKWGLGKNPAGNFYIDLGGVGNVLTITQSNGNVGIGTTSPGAKLEVDGQVKITGGTPAAGEVLTSDSTGLATWEPAPGGVPSGAVMFFNLGSCPPGWSELAAAQGRYLVGLPAGGTLAGTVGTALSNQENRPVGGHNHGVTDPGHTHTAFVAGGSLTGLVPLNYGQTNTQGMSSATTGITINNAGSVSGTNAPYIQLLVCQKD